MLSHVPMYKDNKVWINRAVMPRRSNNVIIYLQYNPQSVGDTNVHGITVSFFFLSFFLSTDYEDYLSLPP